MTEEQIRDKAQAMQRLLGAFDQILLEEGFQKLGINKIAKAAGVNKVLIYRYFGNFNGLLEAYLSQKAYWLTTEDEIAKTIAGGSREAVLEGAIQIFHGLVDQLFQNPVQLEIERWELHENNEILDNVCEKVEAPSAKRNRLMAEKFGIPERELKGIIALVIGGINYLLLRGKTVPLFNDVPLRTDEGVEIIKEAISIIFRKCFTQEEQ
jgi:AcrR family transcriptional regulator